MGVWDWLKRTFGRKAPTRDVSRHADAPLDAIDEVVVEGGPLVEGHRRIVRRDPRLLPKAKPASSAWPRPRKPKLMSATEANRLFSATLRTRSRALRDLLHDEEQLARYGLPVWTNEAEVAEALGISVGTLRGYSVHRECERVRHYVTFEIPKRNGDSRLIMAPKRRLRRLQRQLHEQLVSKLPVSEHAHGFRKGRCIATNAEPHVGKAVVVRYDLRDFFPSVHVGRVRGLLVAYGYSYPVATTLAVLMTESERQPVEVDGTLFHVPVGSRHCVQGAPTSPGLCNAVALRLDRRLAGLARSLGFSYTRYADDLTFSGDDTNKIQGLERLVGRIVQDEGFALNRDKTRVMRRAGRQRVAGVTVNTILGLSRRERRRLRAAIHQLPANDDPAYEQHVRGRLAYLRMLNADQADAVAGLLPARRPRS